MSIIQLIGRGRPRILAESADFDGTNDYMLRGAGLTGAADSKKGIFSTWIRLDTSATAERIWTTVPAGANFNRASRLVDNTILIEGINAANANILQLKSSASYGSSANWIHILASWDLASALGNLYISDVFDLASSVLTNDTIAWSSVTDMSIGANTAGGSKLTGCLAEFYFAPNQYLDFSILGNRRKFITSTGKPVFLGTDGSKPTGIAPLVYFHLDPSEAVADFATNRGTGGNFTITGALTAGSTSPSD